MIDFKDPAITPNEELIATVLGERMKWWNMLMDATIGKDPTMTGVWRYYNDGKSWLFRILRKKNTVFWLTMQDDTFRITFYFGDKAIPFVESGNLTDNEKESFRNAPRFGAIRGVSILIEKEEDIQTVLKWVIIKLQIK